MTSIHRFVAGLMIGAVAVAVGAPPHASAACAAQAQVDSTTRAIRVAPGSQAVLRHGTERGLGTIQGTAWTATNGVLADAAVRLRNARTGRIIATQTTDRAGLFLFRDVEPGTYVVELIGRDRSVLAATEMLNVDPDDVISAVVKLPWRDPAVAGLLGHSKGSAILVTAAAAASGILAAAVTNPPVSGER
jgi:hypothetical protein